MGEYLDRGEWVRRIRGSGRTDVEDQRRRDAYERSIEAEVDRLHDVLRQQTTATREGQWTVQLPRLSNDAGVVLHPQPQERQIGVAHPEGAGMFAQFTNGIDVADLLADFVCDSFKGVGVSSQLLKRYKEV